MLETKILNSKGEKIVLNELEARIAFRNQKIINELGFEIDITTLTAITKKVTDQKFFEIPPADFMPVRVGEGAWSTNLLTYRSFNLADDFATGVLNTGNNNGRMAVADAGVDSLSIDVKNWGKQIGWNLIELNQAARAGNWDLVTSKEKSRKKNWDLGIQKVAFLGLDGDSSVRGLYNQLGITDNETTITKPIKSMTPTELKTFLATLVDDYRANCARTAWPTHFIIPESDYLGLASQASADFPIKSVLEMMEEALQKLTRNPNFAVLPCAYGDIAYSGDTQQKYILLNYDEESVRMDIPVDYTNTLANSVDNFSFQNVGYGQFTGVLAYRPLEMLYFSYTPSE
jgi:hypothetical protein